MRAISQRVQGRIIEKEGETQLFLENAKPDESATDILYLRYAFVTMGREDHIFPSFIVDDWGAEIRGLKVYKWFRQNANEFPRSEIFGFESDGREAQCFIREFEHYVKLPCYAYTSREQTVTEGKLIHKIILKDATIATETAVKTPPKELVSQPLRRARVQWIIQPK
ncbi:MAG: hypothetical protein AAF490_13305 [Chloroflexota bacterium]